MYSRGRRCPHRRGVREGDNIFQCSLEELPADAAGTVLALQFAPASTILIAGTDSFSAPHLDITTPGVAGCPPVGMPVGRVACFCPMGSR